MLDQRRAVRTQWLRERNVEAVNALFTDIWVYGDPEIHDPLAEYGLSSAIRAEPRYTGYLLRPAPEMPARPTRPYVLCSVGGGRDGVALCRAFLEAPLPAGRRGVVVTGSQIDDDAHAQLARLAAARPEIELLRFVPDLMPLLAGAERVVTMGGYNTVCEILRLGKPALVVPRVRPRAEQLVRAERFAALGLIDMLHPDRLTPAALGDRLARPAAGPAPGRIDTGGLDRFAEIAADALAGRAPAGTPRQPLAA